MSKLNFDIQRFVQNNINNTILSGTIDNDSILNSGNYVTIDAGASNDTIENSGTSVKIYAGADNDFVKNTATNVTIDTGEGKDTVYNYFSSYATVHGSINTGAGNGSISNYGDSVMIDAGDGADYIYAYDNNYVTINAGAGNDTVSGYSYYSKISLGTGDDLFNGYLYNSSTLDGGEGNDTINNIENGSVNSGAGNDIISLYSGSSYSRTIKGGTGNDTIYGDSNSSRGTFYQYASGDGEDIIYNFSSQDTISLSGGYYTRETVRNDVIVSLVSGGAITFSGAKNKTIHILGGAHSLPTEIFSNGDDYYENSTASTILNALAGNDKIKNTVSYVTINGGAGNDYLYGFYSKAVIEGGDGFGAYSTISGGAGDDTIYMERGQYRLYQYSEGDGNDIILGFNTKNTLNITDETISNASVNGSDVIFIVGNGSITLEDYAEKSFYLKMGNDSAVETIISSGFVIPPPYGWKYGKSSKTNTNTAIVTATLKTAEDIDLTENYGEGVKTVDGSKTTNGIEFIGNDLGNSIKGGKGADVIYGGAGNDTVSLGAGNDTYIYSGGKDLIQDYAVGQDLIKLEAELQSASLNGSNLVITTDEGKVTVKSVKNKTVTVVNSANETLKIVNEYSTKETILPDGWKYGTSSKTNTNAAIITATLKGAENIDLTEDYGDGVEKVDGSKISGGVEIYGNNLNNSLKGGKGNDILDGGSGNDILISGAGDDTLIYSGGDDTITDYTANHDVIQIDTQEIEILSVETVSANMVYYTDAGNLTVKKGKGKKIELVDQNGDAIKISSINKNVAEDFWFLGSGNNFETCAIDSITEAKYSVTEIQPTEDKTFAQVSVLAYSEDK